MQWKKYINEILLGLIILLGFALRFYHFNELPFTWDEMSAWSRLQFDSVPDLIEFGIKPDGHPAGIQLFLYYWVSLFSDTEWVVKLPFNLMGLASIYIFYLIAKAWWNRSVGLVGASFMASLQIFVLYSPIARPYISGLFFTLMMVYFWSLYMFKVPKRKYLIWFVIFAALSAYNHHFSLLFAAIVGLSGLFFVPKSQVKEYILSGIIIFALYIPHLPIFFHQLGVGGIGGDGNWLTQPANDFPLQFIYWAFHYSPYVMALVIVLVLISLFVPSLMDHKSDHWKKRFVLLLWFSLPIVIGFYYSIFVNPVIQFSMLIFSFPYLLLLLFSGFKELKPSILGAFIILILGVNTYTLINSRMHYQIIFKQVFEENAQSVGANSAKDSNEVFLLYNTIPEYQQYYLKKYQIEQTPAFSVYDKNISISQLDSILLNINQDYVLASGLPENLVLAVRHRFPYLVERKDGYTFESYLFSREKIESLEFHQLVAKSGFGQNQTHWHIPANRLRNDSSEVAFQFLDNQEWGFNYADSLHLLNESYGYILDMEAHIQYNDTFIDPTWVAVFSPSNMDDIWRGAKLGNQLIASAFGFKTFFSLDTRLLIDKEKFQNTFFKTYFWNQEHQIFQVLSVKIYTRKPNPIKYGLFQPILS
ncbi:MAG: hypothetical protein GQ527_05835 [Bacteroidales bacterium]|nr:hypothetical protein [Bacteroidales bacterium]